MNNKRINYSPEKKAVILKHRLAECSVSTETGKFQFPLKQNRMTKSVRKALLYCAFIIMTNLAACPEAFSFVTRKHCVTVDNVRICVQPRGQSGIDHFISEMKSRFQLEIFHVTISNNSPRTLYLLPEKFYGITELGVTVALDAPLYESIELRTKLKRQWLPSNAEANGLILLPAVVGRIQTIVYLGKPTFKLTLY